MMSYKKKPTRSSVIMHSGYLFIATNFFLGIFNIAVGLLSSSIAITSDAVHSFIDSITGFLIIISEKLSSHHRFNQYRLTIERITTVSIALIIIIVGIHIVVEAIERLITPEIPDYSVPTIIVLVTSIVIKYILAKYLKQTGQNNHSAVLIASGAETMNDTWISIAVLFSTITYLIFRLNIEAYISIVIALLVIKVGLEFIFPHLSNHHHHHLESDPDHDHCKK